MGGWVIASPHQGFPHPSPWDLWMLPYWQKRLCTRGYLKDSEKENYPGQPERVTSVFTRGSRRSETYWIVWKGREGNHFQMETLLLLTQEAAASPNTHTFESRFCMRWHSSWILAFLIHEINALRALCPDDALRIEWETCKTSVNVFLFNY